MVEWTVRPEVSLTTEYRDNIRLSRTSPESVWGVIVSPQVSVGGRTPRTLAKSTVRLSSRRYPDKQNFDTDDAYLDFSSRHRTHRAAWLFDAGYSYDSTLTSELDDTGIVQQRKRREHWNVGPSLEYALSRKTEMNLAFQYLDVSYTDEQDLNLFDYDSRSVSTVLSHQLSQTSQVSATVLASQYRSPDQGATFDTRGFQLGVSKNYSPSTEIGLKLGVRRTESEVIYQLFGGLLEVEEEDEDTGGLVEATLKHHWRRIELQAELSRNLNPSGYGYLMQRDTLSVWVKRDLTRVLSFAFSGIAYRNTSLREDITGIDRRYYRVEPSVRWRLGRQLSLAAGYRYSYQKYDHQTAGAEDHGVDATLTYKWQNRR